MLGKRFGGLAVCGNFGEGRELVECVLVEPDEVWTRTWVRDDAGQACGLIGVEIATAPLDRREEPRTGAHGRC